MKKFLLSIVSGSLLFAGSMVSTLEKQDVLNASVYKIDPTLKEYVKRGIIKLKVYKSDDFYIIKMSTPRGAQNVYVTKDKKYTIIGDVINNKNVSLLTPPADKKRVSEGVMFTFGKGDKDIYIVTDPECPFCRKLEKLKGEYLAKNYRVHIILYPLSFHKNAKAMSYYILAGKNDEERAKRLKEVLLGSDKWKSFKPTKEQKERFDKELQKAKAAAEELGANGTPSVYDENFNSISWTQLGEKK